MTNKAFKLLLPIAVSFLFCACTDSPEEYAKRWCELNHKIEISSDQEKISLVREAEELETEIKTAYGSNKEKMQVIYELTDECD